MELRFPLSSSCWLSWHVQNLLSELEDRCVVLTAMQPLQRCLSVAADVAPVHQVCSNLHQPAQYPCVGRDSDVPVQLSVFWPGRQRAPPHVRWSHWTGFLPLAVSLKQSGFLLGDFPHQAGSLSHLSVILLCPSWSMDFAALFAIQVKSVPFLGTSVAHVILCLRSRMTSTGRHLFFRFHVSKEPLIH